MTDSANDIYEAGFNKGREEDIHEGRMEIINTIGGLYYTGRNEGIAEEYKRALKAFNKGVEMLESLGVSSEDVEKFQALYSMPDVDLNFLYLYDDDCDSDD